jgi:hypothetical protein
MDFKLLFEKSLNAVRDKIVWRKRSGSPKKRGTKNGK